MLCKRQSERHNVEDKLVFRFAIDKEWKEAADLVWKTFLKFEAPDYSEEGVANFYDFLYDGEIYDDFVNGDYQVIVAVWKGKIVGVSSFRNKNHLSLLFVDERYQRMGIGSALLQYTCDYIKNEEGLNFMTLTAAPAAVDFYKKLGFIALGDLFPVAGVTVLRMKKDF